MVAQRCLWFKKIIKICQRYTGKDGYIVFKNAFSFPRLPKCEDHHDHIPEGHLHSPRVRWTSSPKLRSNQPPVSVGAQPPHVKDLPSSSRGRRASSRASPRRRESRGRPLFMVLSFRYNIKWWHLTLLFPCSFGDDIPGMEGLGTGEFTHHTSPGSSIKSLKCIILFCCLHFRYYRHLSLGGLQSPGAAWAGSVRHHLSLPRTSLQSSGDYRHPHHSSASGSTS